MQLASRVPYVTSQILTLYKGPLKAENLDLKINIFESWLLLAPNIFWREELLYLIGKASPSQWYEFCINSIREKINIYFSGATFQACLYENNILKFVLHWTLCKFTGALFWFSGANSPRAPVYFFHWIQYTFDSLCGYFKDKVWVLFMWLHCERNGVKSIRKVWSSSIEVLVCNARFYNYQNDEKFGPVLVKLQALYTERCIWDYISCIQNPSRFCWCFIPYLEYSGIWRAMLFREDFLSDVLPHLPNDNDNAHKLFFTSSQNSIFSLNYTLHFENVGGGANQ